MNLAAATTAADDASYDIAHGSTTSQWSVRGQVPAPPTASPPPRHPARPSLRQAPAAALIGAVENDETQCEELMSLTAT